MSSSSWMVAKLDDSFPPEPSGKLSKSDANEHTLLAVRWR
jgi:hypothetical protein